MVSYGRELIKQQSEYNKMRSKDSYCYIYKVIFHSGILLFINANIKNFLKKRLHKSSFHIFCKNL